LAAAWCFPNDRSYDLNATPNAINLPEFLQNQNVQSIPSTHYEFKFELAYFLNLTFWYAAYLNLSLREHQKIVLIPAVETPVAPAPQA
jgi:hypothetical protein